MTATSQPRTARARDAAATRAELLKAARRRFSVLGYERTTSRDIARDAGVNVSLIYRYFGSKEQLFEVVLEETAHLVNRQQAGTVEELVEQFVDGLGRSHPHYGGKHPMVVILRDPGDDSRTAALRHQTLSAVISHYAEQIAGTWAEDPTEEPTAQAVEQARVRAGLLFSMLAGVVSLRDAVPDDPFAQADPEPLRAELTRIARAVVGTRP